MPAYKPGDESSMRVEYRAPDSACNPHLAFSVMLAAGLKGIEKEYPVPPPVEGNVFAMAPKEREARSIQTLPGSLVEAIGLAENSEMVHNALGDHVFSSVIQNKRIEWEEYRSPGNPLRDRSLPSHPVAHRSVGVPRSGGWPITTCREPSFRYLPWSG